MPDWSEGHRNLRHRLPKRSLGATHAAKVFQSDRLGTYFCATRAQLIRLASKFPPQDAVLARSDSVAEILRSNGPNGEIFTVKNAQWTDWVSCGANLSAQRTNWAGFHREKMVNGRKGELFIMKSRPTDGMGGRICKFWRPTERKGVRWGKVTALFIIRSVWKRTLLFQKILA
jgi:hypothetical protein